MSPSASPPWSSWHRVALAIADDGAGWIPSLMPRLVGLAMRDLCEAGLVERVRPDGDLYRLTDAARRLRQAHIDRCAGEYEASGTADAEHRDATSARTWWTAARRAFELVQAQQRPLEQLYAAMDAANRDWSVAQQGPGMAGALLRASGVL